jgi:hypothetical protein
MAWDTNIVIPIDMVLSIGNDYVNFFKGAILNYAPLKFGLQVKLAAFAVEVLVLRAIARMKIVNVWNLYFFIFFIPELKCLD